MATHAVMNHSFKVIREPNEWDILRTMECEDCGLRHVVLVESGESLSGPLLELFPDCDTLLVLSVMET